MYKFRTSVCTDIYTQMDTHTRMFSAHNHVCMCMYIYGYARAVAIFVIACDQIVTPSSVAMLTTVATNS